MTEELSPEQMLEEQKQNCIFCKIVSGEIPSQKVYEDDAVLAIMDIHPATKGHVLLLPKEHFPLLPLVPPPTFQSMIASGQLISKAIKEKLLMRGVQWFFANGAVAGQQMPHVIMHIIPQDAAIFQLPEQDYSAQQEGLAEALRLKFERMYGSADSRREQITQMITENDDVRTLLKTNPDEFKKTVAQHPSTKELFTGVDVDALSKRLNEEQVEERSTEEPKSVEPTEPIEPIEPMEPVKPITPETIPSPEISIEDEAPSIEDKLTQEIDPYEKIKEYFNQKPEAKKLFLTDLNHFKLLLEQRPDVQEIFTGLDLEELQKIIGEEDA